HTGVGRPAEGIAGEQAVVEVLQRDRGCAAGDVAEHPPRRVEALGRCDRIVVLRVEGGVAGDHQVVGGGDRAADAQEIGSPGRDEEIADASLVVSGPAAAGRQDRTGAILQEHVRAGTRQVFQRGRYHVVSAGADRVVIGPGGGRGDLDIIDVPALEVIEDAVYCVEGEADQHSLA